MNKPDEALVLRQAQASAECALHLSKIIGTAELPTEDVPCFCGEHDDEELASQDRYGIPMRVVLCRSCALVRVNPRLTPEAFTKFYNLYYRTLNHPRILTDAVNEDNREDRLYERQVQRSTNLLQLMQEHTIPVPKVVVDWGCHLGGWLKPFQMLGAEVWGIEIDDKAAAYARSKGVNVVSTVDELAAKGVKADFVIMQDLIEHLADLNEVSKLGRIMHPESTLYCWTPGLFRVRLSSNYQLAHTYYFSANSLHWVMNMLGFEATYIDEESTSFWEWQGRPLIGRKPTEWVEYTRDEAQGKEERKLPRFSGVCKFSKDLLYDNMEKCFALKHPDLYDLTQKYSGGVAIIAGGPSVKDEVPTILDLQARGVKIMSILRMYPWCVDNGITPDYVVSLDCTEDQAEGFNKKVPGVKYLFSSVTNPSFFEHVAGEKVYIFDSRDDRKIKALRAKAGYEVCSVVNGGGSVAICSISLAFNLGFRDIHVFGLDLMFTDYQITHAPGIAGTSVKQQYMAVSINGEEVITTPSFMEFANQTLDLVSAAHEEGMLGSVKFHGTSIINKLWDGKFSEELEDAVIVG